MAKCPSCGAEIEAGVKFCSECGAKIPQNKECPQCHSQLPLSAKFCGECGYNFLAAGGGKGSVIGDKNVIAGDVHVDQSSTVNNTTTNNVVNNTNNTTSNVTTTHNYINQDETKHLVKCVVCERQVVITEARTCKECHQYVCSDHYDSQSGMCATCASKKASDAEAVYRKELEVILEDGIVDRDEFDQLEVLRKQLGLSAPRAMELQKLMKAELAAKKSAAKGDTPLMMVERAQCERAKDLLFDSGKGADAVKLLESIYRQHPLNEDVLSTYLAALFMYDADQAKSIISSLPVDMVRAYLVLFDIELKRGDLAAAEIKLSAAEALWPNNMLLKCRRVELMYATAIQLDNRIYLAEAMDLLTSLDKPTDKLEKSWQFYVQSLISQALGDEVPALTPAYCKEKGYYYALVTGQITGIAVINEDELCARCLRNRDFGSGVFPTVTKAEFKVLNYAAERGESRAALVVGDCYFDADGNGVVINNPEEAFLWYKKSAEGGLADAQFMVGACYENGMGCESSEEIALEWYKKAADQGVEDAIARVKDLDDEVDIEEEDVEETDPEEEESEDSDDNEDSEAGDADKMTSAEEFFADDDEDDSEHTYRLEIETCVLSFGRQKFDSRDDLDSSDLNEYDDPDKMEDNDESASLDGAELKVFDEDGDCVFKEILEPTDPSEIEFVNDGDLFPDEPEFDDEEVYLYVCKEYKKNRVSEIVTKGKFNASKLTITYRSILGHDGCTNNLIWNLKYDGKRPGREFVGSDKVNNKWSWLEMEDEYDRNYNVWAQQEFDSSEDDEVEEKEECAIDFDGVRSAIKAIKDKYDCDDIILPGNGSFHKKWSNFSCVAAEKLGKQFAEEDAIAFLNCTVFGSGKNGVLIDKTGICMLNDWTDSEINGFISWEDFAEKGSVSGSGSYVVQICNDPKIGINVSGCNLKVDKTKELFNTILNVVK